jgi:hypothetical protein
MSKADRCSVCVHPARDIIEERILSGEPLKHILKDYPLVLFYHRFVCIEKRDWSELQRPGETDNDDRYPLNLNNRWIINISKRYNYDHFDSVNLGITQFSGRVPQERLYFDLYPVADARIGRKSTHWSAPKLAVPFNYITEKEIPTINTRFKDFDPDLFDRLREQSYKSSELDFSELPISEGPVSHPKITDAWKNAKRETLTYAFVKIDPLKFLFPLLEYGPARIYDCIRRGCTGKHDPEGCKLRPNIGRGAGKCEDKKCKAYCYEDYLGNVVCSECGLIREEPKTDYSNGKLDGANGRHIVCDHELSFPCGYTCCIEVGGVPEGNGHDFDQILDNPLKYDNGQTEAIGGNEEILDGNELDCHNDWGYNDIELDLQSFKGEAYLTTPGIGSAATTRGDNPIRHFCHKHGSYLARPIWWTNPDNKNGKYWFCLKCQKAAGVVDSPSEWEYEDLAILKVLGYESGVWYAKISRYLKEQKKRAEDQIDPDTKNSLYHYQKVLPSDRYLKVAVSTAMEAMNGNPYRRKAKGGRGPGNGADSIARWCRHNFASQVPLVSIDHDHPHYGVIDLVFNVNRIRKILEKAKSAPDKPPQF